MSDIVFHRISPPDSKSEMNTDDLANVLVRRLGLKRKESRSNHAQLLLELIKYRRDNIPIDIEKISKILEVSQSQSYEELRKWRTLGLIEFVKIPSQGGFVKGYMMPANTTNRLLDRVESSLKSFMRKTRRIAKDFDDLLMLDVARSGKEKSVEKPLSPKDEPGTDDEPDEDEPGDDGEEDWDDDDEEYASKEGSKKEKEGVGG